MIKIGDFARLGQVSVVTLRHYDEIGMLKHVTVDSSTGYRYYSVAQLPRLNRILALKDLGFSLEQIEVVLSGLTLLLAPIGRFISTTMPATGLSQPPRFSTQWSKTEVPRESER